MNSFTLFEPVVAAVGLFAMLCLVFFIAWQINVRERRFRHFLEENDELDRLLKDGEQYGGDVVR